MRRVIQALLVVVFSGVTSGVSGQTTTRNVTTGFTSRGSGTTTTRNVTTGVSGTTTTPNLTTDFTSIKLETRTTYTTVATEGPTNVPDDEFVLPFYVICFLVFVLGFILAFLQVFWGDWCCNKCRTRKAESPTIMKAEDESTEEPEDVSSQGE